MDHNSWNERDIMKIVTNPVYTGIGWFPRVVDEEVFIGAVKSVIKEKGLRCTLTTLRDQLYASVCGPVPCTLDEDWVDASIDLIKSDGADVFLEVLLEQLQMEIVDINE